MLSETLLAEIFERRKKLVWNICYPYFMNPADTEDAVQETFLRLAITNPTLKDAEHEQAWLITAARNICKDELRRARRGELPLEAAENTGFPPPEIDETLAVLHELPEKYRTVLYLFYYEELPTAQIARMLKCPDASIRSRLRRGRKLLRKKLGDDYQ